MDASDKTQTQSEAELISALADGQLSDSELRRALDGAMADDAWRWHAYHVIGDVLRSPQLAPRAAPQALLTGLRAAMQVEKAASDAPKVIAEKSYGNGGKGYFLSVKKYAANAPRYRWQVLGLAASVFAVVLVGSTLWLSGSDAGPQVVEQARSAPVLVQATPAPGSGVMVRDARLDQLLAAHRQAGGGSALQMPAGFLRNVTYEGPGR